MHWKRRLRESFTLTPISSSRLSPPSARLSINIPAAEVDVVPRAADLRTQALAVLARQPVLPLPGKGNTLKRWRRLAEIAASDVCLVKVLEAHYDALAILAELGEGDKDVGSLCAAWAAEPPGARLDYRDGIVSGTKAWCSGASLVDTALVSTHAGTDAAQLVLITMGASGITADHSGWNAIGMGRVVSGQLEFDSVDAQPIGLPGSYHCRPGFWHGGAGVAACWFGAVTAIAETLRASMKTPADPYACAHLGAIDVGISAAKAQLRHTAAVIDSQPGSSHQVPVMRLRALMEQLATDVIDRVGRALGPGPLCQDLEHARRCSDLSVFIRQSHAERDWAALGTAAAQREYTWTL